MMKQKNAAFVDTPAWLVLVWCIATVLIGLTTIDWIIRAEFSFGFAASAFAMTIAAITYTLRAIMIRNGSGHPKVPASSKFSSRNNG